jgi:hypothetical protein
MLLVTSSLCRIAVVSSGSTQHFISDARNGVDGDRSNICSRVQRGGQGGGSAGGAHSQLNRVAWQLNERLRETLGFETRTERDLNRVASTD